MKTSNLFFLASLFISGLPVAQLYCCTDCYLSGNLCPICHPNDGVSQSPSSSIIITPSFGALVQGSYDQMGSTSSLQHSTILNAVMGDRPIRPKLTTILLPLIDSFYRVENNFSALNQFVVDKKNIEILSLWSPIEEDYICIQGIFRTFLANMFHGSSSDIADCIDKIYGVDKTDTESLIYKICTFFTKLVAAEKVEGSLYQFEKTLANDDKVTCQYLALQNKQAVQNMYTALDVIHPDLLKLKDEPYIETKDLVTRLEELEDKIQTIAQFLSVPELSKN